MRFTIARSPSDIPTGVPALGIEIPGNRPDLIARCSLGNIDPQHGGSEATGRCAALDSALDWTDGRVPENAVMVTVRFDLDAAAAMAVLDVAATDPLALDGQPDDAPGATLHPDIAARLRAIDRADSFACGEWPGPRPLPTVDQPWLTHGGVGEVEALAAVNWAVGWATPQGGNRLTIEQAVQVVRHWLLCGEAPEPYPGAAGDMSFDAAGAALTLPENNGAAESALLMIARREATDARAEIIRAIEEGPMPMRVHTDAILKHGQTGYSVSEWRTLGCPSNAARLVYTDLRGSTLPTMSTASLAYCLAPVSVVSLPDGRHTVSAFQSRYVDWQGLLDDLNALEQSGRWGGNLAAGIVGSPQGGRSSLTSEQVLNALVQRLR